MASATSLRDCHQRLGVCEIVLAGHEIVVEEHDDVAIAGGVEDGVALSREAAEAGDDLDALAPEPRRVGDVGVAGEAEDRAVGGAALPRQPVHRRLQDLGTADAGDAER